MDNNSPISKPESESSHRDYKAGHYYNSNLSSTVKEEAVEGSESLAENQGQIRTSVIPEIIELTMGQSRSRLAKQGSAEQIEKI